MKKGADRASEGSARVMIDRGRTWHSRPFRKAYNLTGLGASCVELDETLDPILDRASILTKLTWKSHRPGELEEPAQEVYEAFPARLPAEVRP